MTRSGSWPRPGALRLHGLLRHTLEGLKRAPLDEPTRRRLLASQHATVIEAASTVSDALVDEMIRLHMEPSVRRRAPASADSYMVDVLQPEDESG